MERISVEKLPKGTTEALEQKAMIKKMTKKNGKPNLSAYLRYLFAKETGVKE